MAGYDAGLMKDRAPALPFLALLFVVAAGHASLFPRVADLDGFYHLGHAIAYLEGSFFDTSLPWATQSIIGEIGGDLWWGFHVLLLPFAALGDVEGGLRSAGLVLTLALGLTVFAVLRRHGVPGAGWWAALFLIAVPNIFFRYLMVRPHVLSLGASIALLSVLARGRWWQVGLLSFLIAWVHLSLSWMGPALVGAYAVSRVLATAMVGRDDPDVGVPLRAAIPAAFGGALLGWVLRPDPVAAATLVNVQLFELFALKATGAPVTFARELEAIGPWELIRTSWLFATAWTVALIVLGRDAWRSRTPSGTWSQERATLVATAALVSTAFLLLALVSARRALEQWAAFGFLLLPLLWSHTEPTTAKSPSSEHSRRPGVEEVALVGSRKGSGLLRRAPRLVLYALLVAHLGWVAWRHQLNVSQVAFPADSLRGAAEYLEANSAPGDIVFHARWDNFGPLLAHNRSNRYLGGMDPIFLYAHDPESYWAFFYLSADAASEWTCSSYPCGPDSAVDTHLALRDTFGARWVLVEPFRNPLFTLYLLNDPRYTLALETQHEAVFEIGAP